MRRPMWLLLLPVVALVGATVVRAGSAKEGCSWTRHEHTERKVHWHRYWGIELRSIHETYDTNHYHPNQDGCEDVWLHDPVVEWHYWSWGVRSADEE